MEWIIGAIIIAVGLTLVIAGAQGSGEQLYTAVTGKTPVGSSKTSATSNAIGDAIGDAAGAAVGSAQTNASGINVYPGFTVDPSQGQVAA